MVTGKRRRGRIRGGVSDPVCHSLRDHIEYKADGGNPTIPFLLTAYAQGPNQQQRAGHIRHEVLCILREMDEHDGWWQIVGLSIFPFVQLYRERGEEEETWVRFCLSRHVSEDTDVLSVQTVQFLGDGQTTGTDGQGKEFLEFKLGHARRESGQSRC